MGGILDAVFGGGESTSTTQVNVPPMTEEEKALLALNTQLAQKQLDNLNNLAPFQRELLDTSLAELRRSKAERDALDAAISPEQRAAAEKADFERSQRLGPIQDEILKYQLEQIRSGGAATPEQLQRIKEAADAGIAAGSADIDASTQRGIGLIKDELANSRGLRLSDSPIGQEAALLAREGEIQKGSLVKNLRAGEATARLNYPLAAGQITSGINLATSNLADAARQFQAEVRQRAALNRQSLFGSTSGTGLGLASVGNGTGASTFGALSGVRSAGAGRSMTNYDPNAAQSGLASGMGLLGGLAKGIGLFL